MSVNTAANRLGGKGSQWPPGFSLEQGGDWTSLRHNEASVTCNADIKVWSKRIEMKHMFGGQTGKECSVFTSTLNVSRHVNYDFKK